MNNSTLNSTRQYQISFIVRHYEGWKNGSTDFGYETITGSSILGQEPKLVDVAAIAKKVWPTADIISATVKYMDGTEIWHWNNGDFTKTCFETLWTI